MDGWMDVPMGWMDGCPGGWMDACPDGWTRVPVDVPMDGCPDAHTRTDGWVSRYNDGSRLVASARRWSSKRRRNVVEIQQRV